MNQDEQRPTLKIGPEINDADCITINAEKDQITMYGICYSREIFRGLGIGKIGMLYRLEQRQDGVVTIHVYAPGEQVTA